MDNQTVVFWYQLCRSYSDSLSVCLWFQLRSGICSYVDVNVRLSVCDFSYTVVHRSEVIMKTLNPTWKPFTIMARALCNGDYDRWVRYVLRCSQTKKKKKTHNLVVLIDECIFSSDIEFTHLNVQLNLYSFFFAFQEH